MTSKTSPAIGSPLLFSHCGQLLTVSFGKMIPRSSLVARQSCRNLREQFRARFFAALPQNRGEIRSRFAKQIGTRFSFLRRANLRPCFSAHCSASACTFWGVIGQWPGQSFAGKNPTLFGIRQFFMPSALLKHKDLVHQSVSQELAYPLGLRTILKLRVLLLQTRDGGMSVWSPKTVAGFSNITEFSAARIDERIDDELSSIGHLRAKCSTNRVNERCVVMSGDPWAFFRFRKGRRNSSRSTSGV